MEKLPRNHFNERNSRKRKDDKAKTEVNKQGQENRKGRGKREEKNTKPFGISKCSKSAVLLARHNAAISFNKNSPEDSEIGIEKIKQKQKASISARPIS
jgi:hypothetical protein